MRLVIDTNILLDVLLNRYPYVDQSSQIWRLCETGQVEGHVLTLSFANLIYVMRKRLAPDLIGSILGKIALIFHFADLRYGDLERAAALGWSDYEDAIHSVTAERLHADYIISRNPKDFSQSRVPAITPAAFLELFIRIANMDAGTGMMQEEQKAYEP